MKIENTELEYNEADAIVLDYWLGGDGETKEQWAKRVWDNCKEFKETDGKGHDGQGMCDVYAKDPRILWNNKKLRRRVQFYQEMPLKCKKKFDINIIEECPPEICDQVVIEMRKHPFYSTKQQRDDERREKIEKKRQAAGLVKSKKLDFYKSQGRSDSDILLTHPELGVVMESRKGKPLIQQRRGKK